MERAERVECAERCDGQMGDNALHQTGYILPLFFFQLQFCSLGLNFILSLLSFLPSFFPYLVLIAYFFPFFPLKCQRIVTDTKKKKKSTHAVSF